MIEMYPLVSLQILIFSPLAVPIVPRDKESFNQIYIANHLIQDAIVYGDFVFGDDQRIARSVACHCYLNQV